jgi:amino acid transporter
VAKYLCASNHAERRLEKMESSQEKDFKVNEGGPRLHDPNVDVDTGTVLDNAHQLKRSLGNRQIQLIAVGGSIGTALFISIGSGLSSGGPASLLIAFTVYCGLLALVNNSMAEMAVFMPVSSSFIRMAGKWVDDAFGFMAGWNFFLFVKCSIW